MKSYIHDLVSRLLELHSLEERLAAFPRNRDERTNVEALLESLRANLPVGMVIVHDQMKTRGKRSVAEVRHGVCSGCHLGLAIGNVNALTAGDLRRCGNCGRYLYVVEEEEAKDEAPPPPGNPHRKARKRSTTEEGRQVK
jgi:predicted  nucleic acid-binding Zn-ribbon protein